MNIKYAWSLYSRSLNFRLPTFGLDRLFAIASSLRISCGCWVTLTIDEVQKDSQCPEKLEELWYSGVYERTLSGLQIRLLRLCPGQPADDLQGELITMDLGSETIEYAAVSHVWGAHERSGRIRINGRNFFLSRNLEICLRRLRNYSDPLLLWVDSICINQSDMAERSQQVEIMGCVYSEAQRVAVWLGEETPNSHFGMMILQYFADCRRPSANAPWQLLPPDLALTGLSDVMNREWFKRMWVVQEAALSKTIEMICGSYCFTWPASDPVRVRQFTRMIKYAAIQPEWRNRNLATIDMRPLLELLDLQIGQQLDRSHGSTSRQAADLLDKAYDLRNRVSSDPRDMVFALRGIAEGMMNGELTPDYRFTLEQTYQHLESVIQF